MIFPAQCVSFARFSLYFWVLKSLIVNGSTTSIPFAVVKACGTWVISREKTIMRCEDVKNMDAFFAD